MLGEWEDTNSGLILRTGRNQFEEWEDRNGGKTVRTTYEAAQRWTPREIELIKKIHKHSIYDNTNLKDYEFAYGKYDGYVVLLSRLRRQIDDGRSLAATEEPISFSNSTFPIVVHFPDVLLVIAIHDGHDLL